MTRLSSAELVTLLQYHALASYTPKASLESVSGSLPTLASNAAGKYELSIITRSDDVTLKTGVDDSRIANTVLDNTPVSILTIENVLLPIELFGVAPSPAPTPSPSASAAPGSTPEAKVPTPTKSHKKTKHHSPPAPPMLSPELASADAPTAAADKAETESAAIRASPLGTMASIGMVLATWAMAYLVAGDSIHI